VDGSQIQAGGVYANRPGTIWRRVLRIYPVRPRRGAAALWCEFEICKNETRRNWNAVEALRLRRFARLAHHEITTGAAA
jgi:hypothetical protein